MKVKDFTKDYDPNLELDIRDISGYEGIYKGPINECPKKIYFMDAVSGRFTAFNTIRISINTDCAKN